MKEIQLTQNRIALIDDEDYDKVNTHKWCAQRIDKISRSDYYARTSDKIGNKRTVLYLHKLIIGKPPKNMVIDHIDGNTLNNQKSNLRFVTCSQNAQNQKTQGNKISKYKGVHVNKRDKLFFATIWVNGKSKYLGSRKDEIAVAKLYDEAALKYFGEFAYINFK